MLLGYGYVCRDVPPSSPIQLHKHEVERRDPRWRASSLHIVQAAIGPVLKGIAPPIPDGRDPETVLDGCKRRFLVKPPASTRSTRRRFRQFVRKWLRDNLDPLTRDEVLSFDEWLERSNYPNWRKLEIRKAWEDSCSDYSGQNTNVLRRHGRLKSFCKVECYTKYKPARAINSRSDSFKAFSGRFFKSIEEKVFALPYFIKHIPVKDRSKYLDSVFSGWQGPYYQTDYSHFESHFTPEYMKMCEFELYKYMMGGFPCEMEAIMNTMAGMNVCQFREFTVKVKGVRMSGEMCTSLGNGFANLMNTLFLVKEKGGTCVGVVEGDDGLFAANVKLDHEDYKRLGFDIKIEEVSHYRLASFCGIVSSVRGNPLADPRRVLLTFGWTHSPMMSSKNSRGLLRAKALSLLYEHPNCPILTQLAMRYIALTEGSKPIFSSNWYERLLNEEVIKFSADTLASMREGIDWEVRMQFADCYGIDVQHQLQIEKEISSWSFGEISSSSVLSLFDGP